MMLKQPFSNVRYDNYNSVVELCVLDAIRDQMFDLRCVKVFIEHSQCISGQCTYIHFCDSISSMPILM